jgi:hypothetical protein
VLRKRGERFAVDALERDFVGVSARELYQQVFDIDELDDALLRHPAPDALDDKAQRRIQELDALDEDQKLSASGELERARMVREDHVRRRVDAVLDEREDERNTVMKLRGEIKRLETRIKSFEAAQTNSTAQGAS